jgi:hypothetical protein
LVSAGFLPLAALGVGPYITVAQYLDWKDLCHIDSACRLLLTLNGSSGGPWNTIGDRTFYGIELEIKGSFMQFEQARSLAAERGWKWLYAFFHREVVTFSPPFSGSVIANIGQPDEMAYCRCRFRTDLLLLRPDRGIYIELDVSANADNMTLGVVDFDGGGRSSVTFSPETGAVFRERLVRVSP